MNSIKSLPDIRTAASLATLALAALILVFEMPAAAASLDGQVFGAGAPIANSTVTLFAASAGVPKHPAQSANGTDVGFTLIVASGPGKNTILYLVPKGGTPAANKSGGANSAIALMSVLGTTAPKSVTINELTTVAPGPSTAGQRIPE